MPETQNRILIGHSYWGRGGAEVAAMRLIEALCQNYKIDIVTRGGFDLEELNHCSGTNIRNNDLNAIRFPPLTPKVNSTGGALWHGIFLRYCRRIAPEYDLCITASRTLDWGVPAIHFLSDVAWNRPLQERFDCPEAGLRANLIRRAYFGAASLLAGTSGRDLTQHDTLVANSEWTARMSAEFCGRPPVVIYPAVPPVGQGAAWVDRENAFLCLGRISPEKRIEQVIAILDQVRGRGHSVRLHLAGGGGADHYSKQIEALCAARREWITVLGPVYGEAKQALLGRCRYGINACEREAFGIATLEMAMAGMVPFVPQAGAQSEMISDDALIYRDVEDAVLKMDTVLQSGSRQMELHKAMLRRGAEFNPEHFCAEVRDLVKHMLETRSGVGDNKFEIKGAAAPPPGPGISYHD